MPIIYLPVPTWGNHHAVFRNAGLQLRTYRYYKPSTRSVDFEVRCAAVYCPLRSLHGYAVLVPVHATIRNESVS